MWQRAAAMLQLWFCRQDTEKAWKEAVQGLLPEEGLQNRGLLAAIFA